MKKVITSLIFSLIVLVTFGAELKAQIPKEGTTSETWAFSSTIKALPMGQEHIGITAETMGVAIGETNEDLFHNVSFRCLGALYAVKGEFKYNNSFCVLTRPDGDQVFYTCEVTGKMGIPGKGSATIVGGTGKLTGIQGSAEYTEFILRPAAEGTVQGYIRSKGHYKLP
jgi:hypothetical protein